jgi:hypothetical protein
MDYSVIIYIIMFVLLAAAVLIFVKRDDINDHFNRPDFTSDAESMVGGAKRKTGKRSTNGHEKKTAKKQPVYTKHKSALSNVHNNENAKYIFIYFGDLYPDGLKESAMFKSLINQTSFKNEAYGVYERATNGQWVDNMLVDEAWDDFESKIVSTFKYELMNGARLVLIGKGFGAFYSKIFKYQLGSVNLNFHRAIALNGFHLRELIPALIMQKTGLMEIDMADIEFKKTECLFQGKDYIKELGLSIYVYLLMFICDGINNTDYYSFYGDDGTDSVEIVPFNDIYDNTYIARYGRKFTIADWLNTTGIAGCSYKEGSVSTEDSLVDGL